MKSVNQLQLQRLLEHFPYILVFHHFNLSAKEWTALRIGLIDYSPAQLCVVKNKKMGQSISKSSLNVQALFQGPCFVVGVSTISECQQVAGFLSKVPKVDLVGGIFQGELFTHLDIAQYFRVSDQTFPEFLQVLTSPYKLVHLLRPSFPLTPVFHVYQDLFWCLEHVAKSRGNPD